MPSFEQAVQHFQSGHLGEAEAVLAQLLQADPDSPDAKHLLGLLAFQRGEAAAATALLEQSLQVRPDHAECQNNLGLVLAAQGRLEDAWPRFRNASLLAPEQGGYLKNLGVCLQRLGRAEESAEAYRRLMELGVDDPEVRHDLGRLLLHLGERHLRLGHGAEAAARILEALVLSVDEATRAAFLQLVRKGWSGAALEPWLARALDESWCRPSDLWPACLAVLTADDGLAGLERADFGSLGGNRLLLALLACTPLADPALERLATRWRSGLLELAEDGGELAEAGLAFACALARQCFLTGHVHALSPRDRAVADRLRAGLEAALDHGDPIPGLLLAAAACCFPLHTVAGAGRLQERSWPAPVREVLVQQVANPATEARLRAALPALTRIRAGVSSEVQAQYEEDPYPCWTRTWLPPPAPTFDAFLEQEGLAGLFRPLGLAEGADLLVAGCGTGREAIEAARACRGARVLAVDLSRASLAYGQRRARELGVDNITFAQADLLELGSLGRTFDGIIAFGVLHHLADPLAGWRTLAALLSPAGVMKLGLYSERGRAEVVAARALIAARGYAPDPEGIRACRRELTEPGTRERFARLITSQDFHGLSACRDLLFHVQEHRYTIPGIAAALASLGLVFGGFQLPPEALQAYSARFPEDPSRTRLENWDRFEAECPILFSSMYQFWVQRKD
jgi:2-polyprenyl-3-methyl-5-hydroxy-6-metoxy-1,4-benzoquinol methylase/tetratricopeptide (TPR) repeat protein